MTDEPVDIVVIGSCMIDLISYVDELPRPGETIHGISFSQGFGGKGANQCVMAAKLGARCAMVAKVGDDCFGQDTIQNFRDNAINMDHVATTSKAKTGVASITVNGKGENAIVIVGGANNLLSAEEVIGAEGVISCAKVVVCQLEVNPETTLTALKVARKHNVLTLLNPAPAQKDLSREYFENTDILCLNETEAELLTGVPFTAAEDIMTSATKAVDKLQTTGTRCIILTMGEKGLVFSIQVDVGGVKRWTSTNYLMARKVEVVDTTGAGDAFIGALVHFLNVSKVVSITSDVTVLMEDILTKAGWVASRTVTAKGTQTSFNVNLSAYVPER